MPSLNRETLPSALPLPLLAFLIILPILARGDDLTGLTQDDPKDLIPLAAAPPQPSLSTDAVAFLPLPSWSRLVTMPPLPDQLKPLGKKITVAANPAPPPLAPPKDPPPVTSEITVASPNPKPSPAESNPALITVSPFLQWIKANPQAAAAEARQQANTYHAPATDSGSPNHPGTGTASAPEEPYWLPPMLDSPESSPSPGGSSAAIYQTPQR